MDIRTFLTKKPRLEESSSATSCSSPDNSKQDERQSHHNSKDLDLGKRSETIKQVILNEYPKQSNNRSFRASWYKQFKWLQYSPTKDAAFCYACVQFNPNGTKETAYTESGFRNWKNALDVKRGFPKHEKCQTHLQAMIMWEERKLRISTCTSVSSMVNETVLEKHRYYVKSIVEVIQFLVVNELSLRGNYVIEEATERGLFTKLFEYTMKKDKTLAETAVHIPKNATYTSPEIQNEIIQIMAAIVRECIVTDIKNSDVPWFTLMEDGTKDKNNRENVAIAIRYVKDGKVKESLLDVITTKKLDAKTFTEATLKTLEDNGLDTSHLLSQCYDGASVMSGKSGGVSARIQKTLSRNIPYVHCYNHRLHLVVVRTVSEITVIRQFFDQCIMLHEFFHHGKVAALYEGNTIVRLLEQRWSGHLDITKVILANYVEIIRVLDAVMKGNFSGEDVAKSTGMKTVMVTPEFRFCLVLCKRVLGLLQPADAVLQNRKTGLRNAVEIVQSVKQSLYSLRKDSEFKSILDQSTELLSKVSEDGGPRKRQIKSVEMKDFVITERLPAHCEMHNSNTQPLKGVFYETLDVVISQLNERFSDNEELLTAISSVEKFEVNKLESLEKLGK